jgi:hypothetical protein
MPAPLPFLSRVAALQAATADFTSLGGLQAVEERLLAVQDFEAKLDELDKLAETYRVSYCGWCSHC